MVMAMPWAMPRRLRWLCLELAIDTYYIMAMPMLAARMPVAVLICMIYAHGCA